MEMTSKELIVYIIIPLVNVLVALFMIYFNTRLSALKEEVIELKDEVHKLKDENAQIKNNYLTRFEKISNLIVEMRLDIIKQISNVEKKIDKINCPYNKE